jgi:ABC-type branched-subunit amino acid transport system substrate-binding protein
MATRTTANRTLASIGLALAAGGAFGCGESPPPGDSIGVGLMLSYTHYLAANSVNSERAVLMAIEAANAAGGIEGRPLQVVPRDTHSAADKVVPAAQQLIDAGVAIFIGPDTADTVSPLRALLAERTMILPSYSTGSDLGFGFKPSSWFVMGAAASRVACELHAQLAADGRKNTLLIANPTGYGSTLAWEITNAFAYGKYVLATDQASTASSVQPIVKAGADSYILAAFPSSASSLVYALSAVGALDDPSRWYLAPTLHTPVFLSFIPTGSLDGAHGVSAGTAAGAAEFDQAFVGRWEDHPLDEAYAFYDAAVVAALAIERAVVRERAIPAGTGLTPHVLAVTTQGQTPVHWNELGRAFEILRAGQEIEYIGLAGPIEFDSRGTAPAAPTKWWTIGPGGFADVPERSDCK